MTVSQLPGPLRVALADDHAVVRAGYRRLLELEADIAVVAEYGDAESAYNALAGGSAGDDIDLLVLDLSMPGRSGLELLRRLSQRRPDLSVLVFTMHDSAAMLDQCLRAGAAGFVTKSSAPEVLVTAVRLAARGEIALSPDVAALAARSEGGPPHTRLSSREFDILQQLLAGRGVEEIAQTLRLSTKTVANYQTRIRQALGVGSAVELLNYAREHGLGGPGV
ncbi:response regulator transcription factor [Methylibium sp.]|uniref:response regulator transcription factor n=1 Tax=Methylibium sp. TaxID=2067992 RepID=UPI0033414B0B